MVKTKAKWFAKEPDMVSNRKKDYQPVFHAHCGKNYHLRPVVGYFWSTLSD